jgi:pyridoxal phosphate enzyme (YggS family)
MTSEDPYAAIRANARRILDELPPTATLVAAAKGRTAHEVRAALDAGVRHVGHNYVQEARAMRAELEAGARWHMIGHLQRNKAKLAVELFDMVETVDSWRLAKAIERRCELSGRDMPVLIEVNSGREESKAGVPPDELDDLVLRMQELAHVRLQGLMTMGPRFGDPEGSRPYFETTRAAFERLAARDMPNVEMRFLSMGMSNSWRVAVEEGANIVRIGTEIFGPRQEGG